MAGNNAQSGAMNMTSTGSYGAYRLSKSTLEGVQQQLQQQGFYRTGKVDGRWGPETHQAVLSFPAVKGPAGDRST
jgi:peptidoglycan hydrolase-like protein with peptidoglycan-binding domain